MVKFSIIVAVYNIELYIDQCINSLVKQTYSNIEIILVNDGATDHSPQKLEEWRNKDPRIIVINKQNAGLSSARNEGLKHATGDYISYIDGDDWLDLSMYKKLADKLSINPELDILNFSYINYWDASNQETFSFKIDDKVYNGATFFLKSQFSATAWSKIYKRTFLEQNKLKFLEGRLHEDISYTIPLCMLASRVSYLNTPLLYYRRNRVGCITGNIKERNINDDIHAIGFCYIYLKYRKALNQEFCQWVLRNFYFSCFTSQTNYLTLAKCMISNNVPKIIEEIAGTSPQVFFIKLFICHQYKKTRTYIGMLKNMVFSKFKIIRATQ